MNEATTPQYVPHLLHIINQTFDIERKAAQQTAILRHVERIKSTFDALGYRIHNPTGEAYRLTRTDCEASMVGNMNNLDNLVITDVIKPIVHVNGVIVQKGVVIVESKN